MITIELTQEDLDHAEQLGLQQHFRSPERIGGD